jgi:hypothetical protein
MRDISEGCKWAEDFQGSSADQHQRRMSGQKANFRCTRERSELLFFSPNYGPTRSRIKCGSAGAADVGKLAFKNIPSRRAPSVSMELLPFPSCLNLLRLKPRSVSVSLAAPRRDVCSTSWTTIPPLSVCCTGCKGGAAMWALPIPLLPFLLSSPTRPRLQQKINLSRRRRNPAPIAFCADVQAFSRFRASGLCPPENPKPPPEIGFRTWHWEP